ncbi:PAS domain-containing sensor histidine kinase [Methylobacterium soli]|uniref:Blue-light-activated histidine kinase n=1 Tax=Methylobacterium soli TaxID=553447 RepID=A0A6L3SZW8_9HYPH|nr:HWE histidine kinase domain-containing protein [Methylobacterium soli]KAB1078950.1 PAS domain S-box protein [Methylobacterium soli]GJE42370.1 hypothetical protein AEGHOMDF_1542 [Methylobacterium soli]
MAGRIRAQDWGATPLGPAEGWSDRLKLMVEQVLASPLVATLVCGSARILIYNDVAARLYGDRHPSALGRPLPKTFPEGWATVEPFYARAFAGETVHVTGQPLDTRGEGNAADIFDALLMPVREADGTVAYVHMTGTEVGSRVRTEAALRASEETLAADLTTANLLRDLADRLVTEENVETIYEEILSAAIAVMQAHAGTVQVYNPETKSLVLLVARNFERAMTDHFHRVDAGSRTACGIALRTSKRTFIDFGDDDTEEASVLHAEAGYGSAQATPLVSRTGTPLGMLNTHWRTSRHRPSERQLRYLDLLARQAADLIDQRQSQRILRESEERLQQFGEASSDVLWIRDSETLQWVYLTPAFETIYGLDRKTALRGNNMTGWLDLIVPDDRQTALDSIQSVRAGERASFEYRIRRPSDGLVRWLRNTDFPMRDAAGRVCWLGGVGRDITEEKAATWRQEVLVNELQHRARNLLGVVAAVAGRTLRQGGSVDAFEERLQALSRAQALLSQHGSDSVEVGALVRAELAAHTVNGSRRARVGGPEVHLTARQVQNFALALHELATNAAKYGALKDSTGRLAVTWEIVRDRRECRRVALDWIESGVVLQPEAVMRRGYGTELIQEALAYALEAQVDYIFGEDGVRCRIEMPIT